MEIITRAEAKRLGLKRYFTGKACKYGHISERYSQNCGCAECIKAKMKDYASENKKKKKEYYEKTKEDRKSKVKEYGDKYREKNKEIIKERNKKYQQENKEKIRQRRQSKTFEQWIDSMDNIL